MASYWKCIERKDGRTGLRQPVQNLLTNISTKTPSYQNSYRLESRHPFETDHVDQIIKTTMENRLEDVIYDAATASSLCSQIAQEIRKKLMKLEFDRYKIMAVVTMMEKSSQSLDTAAGFVWDIERDNYATYSFENPTFCAYCFVVGSYYQ